MATSAESAALLGGARGAADTKVDNELRNLDNRTPEERAAAMKLANDELEFVKVAEKTKEKAATYNP
jgi:hypothetical protein